MKRNSKIFLTILIIVLLGGGIYLYNHNNQNEEFSQDFEGYENDNEMLVYESEVDGPDECSSREKFDPEYSTCYFECSNEQECEQIQNSIDQELSSWTDELEQDNSPVGEKSISEDDPSLQANYKVNSGESVVFINGSDQNEYRMIWGEIAELSPDQLSDKYIEEFQIFDNSQDDTLAFVDDEDQNGKWRVAVNLAGYKGSSVKENKATFIHELGHIVSLNSSQVVPTESCNNLQLDEGCANTNSYINIFKNKFWLSGASSDFDPNKFVTEYATTDVVEDWSESFAFFVLSNDLSELGNKVRDEKLKYFYNFPELVSIRKEMRQTLGRSIVLNQKAAN